MAVLVDCFGRLVDTPLGDRLVVWTENLKGCASIQVYPMRLKIIPVTSGIRALVKHDVKVPTERKGWPREGAGSSRETTKKRDKSKVREPFCNPSLSGRAAGEEGEGSDIIQLDEKIIGVEAGLSALNRRIVVVENNFSSLKSVAI